MKTRSTGVLFAALCALAMHVTTQSGFAQTAPAAAGGAEEAAELAKKLSNPVASLVSVPFQANWDSGVGPNDDTRFIHNFQPVMPFAINKDWNLIARIILPYIGQPALVAGGEPTNGFSDILLSAFVSPASPKGIIWGVGPVLALPTSTDPFLGSGRWAGGPTGLVLKQAGHWTIGGLANHVWSFAGDAGRGDVSSTYVQPFAAYGTKSGYTYTLSSESSINWQADNGQKLTIPLIFQVSKVLRLGKRPMSVGIGAGRYFETPDGGPEWKIRASLTLIFPK